jgi:muconolactone delta-isomerase
MLFLFKGETEGVVPIAPEQYFEIAVKQVETLMSYKQQGKILAGGIMVGRRGSYAIFDVDSSEELQRLVSQMPMLPFIENEIVPLVSYEDAQESAKKIQASMRASK